MAYSQLTLYNDALLLLGLRSLNSLTEDRESRRRLDAVFSVDAVNYCLQWAMPTFARETNQLNTPTTSTDHGFTSVHALPADYLAFVAVYSDAKLDEPINRYILEDSTLACDYADVRLRFISSTNATVYAKWTPSFGKVVAAFLAREVATRFDPDQYDKLDGLFQRRAKAEKDFANDYEVQARPTAVTTTLSNAWLNIYNDALLILGLDKITSNNDDSFRRVKLDQALDNDLVSAELEDNTWQFGLTSVKSIYDPSLEPDFGPKYVHAHPSDMHILDGIYSDEHMRHGVKYYKDEGGYFFTELQEVYIQYVSTDFLTNPNNWPSFFKRLIAGRLARDAAAGLKADVMLARDEYEERLDSAQSIDVMRSPPKMLTHGNWVSARFRGRGGNRPEDY